MYPESYPAIHAHHRYFITGCMSLLQSAVSTSSKFKLLAQERFCLLPPVFGCVLPSDIPAGQFTLPELRSIPVVGAKAQVIYLLLVKLKRIRVTDVADEAYAIM